MFMYKTTFKHLADGLIQEFKVV